MSNPFASFVNAVVPPAYFIGRKELLKSLEDRASGTGSINIIGLPRMGKTSLVKNCFILGDRLAWWVKEHRRIPLYLSLDTQPTARGIWGLLAKELRDTLRKIIRRYDILDAAMVKEWTEELTAVRSIPLADDRYTEISGTIQRMMDEAGLLPIIILDEFDSVLRYKYPREFLSQLRSLAQESPVVTCSRRLPASMERKLYETGYFSNTNLTLFVGIFSNEDVDLYWSQFASSFDFLDPVKYGQYRELVNRYVGHHPMLMSFMNHKVLENDAYLLRRWANYQSIQDQRDIERAIRIEIHREFKEQLRYLEEQNLQDTAIRLVVGGMGKPDSDIRDSLLRYQFIRAVNSEEKREVFGYDLGYREGNARYVCFSDFSSHQMVDMFDPPMEGFDLLKETENLLRQLVRNHMADFEEDDPFGLVYDENGYVHERWEEPFLRQVRETIQSLPIPTVEKEGHLKRLREDFQDILSVWDKRYNNDFEPTMESKIDIVSSSTLGSLWNVFIRWQWQQFYADILADKVKYRTNSSLWYKEVFEPVLLWRNAVNHFRDEEWKETAVAASQEKCRQICHSIENWMKRKM